MLALVFNNSRHWPVWNDLNRNSRSFLDTNPTGLLSRNLGSNKNNFHPRVILALERSSIPQLLPVQRALRSSKLHGSPATAHHNGSFREHFFQIHFVQTGKWYNQLARSGFHHDRLFRNGRCNNIHTYINLRCTINGVCV